MNILIIYIFINLVYGVISFEIVVPTLIGAAALYSHFKAHTYCRFKECCTKNEIPANFTHLKHSLEKKVYGQHLVQDILLNSLKAHWGDLPPQKALTLSFHGWPGGGKNYVTKFIIESLYREGSQSNHVHHFMGRIHFPSDAKADTNTYRNNLYQWIKGNVSNCGKQLFIFDEVDKMPPNVLDVIKPLIDYNTVVDKVDFREAIFIFLSNTGGLSISKILLDFWKSGKKREEIQLRHFEKLIIEGAFNEKGGFYHSDTIKSNLIDYYLPFLPLEYEHVRLCIIHEFNIRNVTSPNNDHISEIMEHIHWAPDTEKLYSKTGCKRLSQLVAITVQKHYNRR